MEMLMPQTLETDFTAQSSLKYKPDMKRVGVKFYYQVDTPIYLDIEVH